MNISKIMELVNNICSHKGDEFTHAEALLNLVPMTEQKRKQLHIWEIPYAENGFVEIYFYFGELAEPHREFCLSTGTDDSGEFVFVISEVVTKGSFSELKKLRIDYFTTMKPMTERMTWNAKEKRWDAPMHSIYDILIREAAKCKSYCSDVLYDIDGINHMLSIKDIPTREFWIGFRDLGVDSKGMIELRRESPEMYGENPYRVVYILRFEIEEDDPTEGKVIFYEEGSETS